MAPRYFFENRYSFVVDAVRFISEDDYEIDTAETAFERNIQRRLATANRLLMENKFSAALPIYQHIRGLIAATFRPQITVHNGTLIDHSRLGLAKFDEALVAKSAELLAKTPVINSSLPDKFRTSNVEFTDQVAEQFAVFEKGGIRDGEQQSVRSIDSANALIEQKKYSEAGAILATILEITKDGELKGALQHDIGVLQERDGKLDVALASVQQSAASFHARKSFELEVSALETLAGMQLRGDGKEAAAETMKNIDALVKKHRLVPLVNITKTDVTGIVTRGSLGGLGGLKGGTTRGTFGTGTTIVTGGTGTLLGGGGRRSIGNVARDQDTGDLPALAERAASSEELTSRPVQLISTEIFARRQTQKELTIVDSASKGTRIRLDGNAAADLTKFYDKLQTTKDVGLLMAYLQNHSNTIAYLTHIYSWIIPMAVGDCLAGLGSFEAAEQEYISTVQYKYLNQTVEVVNLWLRLADLYLDWGDRLYRDARNDISRFGEGRAIYERIYKLDNTLPNDSPLYSPSQFGSLKTRVEAIIQGLFVNATVVNDNPRLQFVIRRARYQIFKIDNQLNYIGLGVHIPPFGFEYLQNIARYFAQHAAQIEQMYIQFKSTGENEELREEQMAQQAEMAAASVELEQRGVNEAEEGVDVANANLNYTDVQLNNAKEIRDEFNSVKAELQEIARLQAWAGSASGDEVKLNVKNATYYSADSKKRSHVLFDLASRRAQISNQIETLRLQNEVESANAYKAVAQQQVEQAQARVEVAEQRVAMAQLQQQNAEENLAFLSGREFSSAMWYNLAREARRLTGRYVDMAIEVATMMEKAYEAETGRDLRKIKFDYGIDRLNGLLGSDALLLDIDYFSLDFVRTKSKKAQMKQVISLADQFPMAFNRLLGTGRTFFETTLEHFDRRYPGFYLQKIKQAELMFIGLNGTEGVHGTLRNIGLSRFRQKSGAIVEQTYPADVMPLSDYDIKQDAVVFQLDSKELRLFENNGIATMWQLDLPLSSNTFELGQVLDIQLVLYYDGFFDAGLEQNILAALPATGQGARALSLRLYAPDELFFLKSQGSAQLDITPNLFPANQSAQQLTRYRIQALGESSVIDGLKLKVEFVNAALSHTFTLDSSGNADGAVFNDPVNKSLFDSWKLSIEPADNPDVDLGKLDDISVYIEYDFDYRS